MCKPSTSAYCLPSAYKDYEDAARPELTLHNDPKRKKGNNKHSEEVGTFAAIAYNALRHGLTFAAAQAAHIEFRGPGVPDLLYVTPTGTIEVKEAKGGSGGYGDRKDHLKGGRVKQCTPEYMEVIIDLMKNSNFNGRHPEVACLKHGAPIGTCKDCKNEEKKRRRKSGSDLYTAFSLDQVEKHSVRGGYEGDCLKQPAKIEAYQIVGNKKVKL